jgi:hypothetical protein
MPHFDYYIGIDYSGAETPTASLKGLREYLAAGRGAAAAIAPWILGVPGLIHGKERVAAYLHTGQSQPSFAHSGQRR